MNFDIFTIGHSTQPGAQFLQRLKRHDITLVADVRSSPYSRYNPQFNREELQGMLKAEDIRYVFLGKELGARSSEDDCYVNDRVQYGLLAQTGSFRAGITRLIEGAERFRIALMCAEKDPLDCHRTILIARELTRLGRGVQHILIDGALETHPCAIERLIGQFGLLGHDLFRSHDAAINEAYDKQEDRIAYRRKPGPSSAKRNDDILYYEDESG